MKVLGFDTATEDAAVALIDGDRILFERAARPSDGGRPAHSTELLAMIEEAIAAAGGWPRIDAIAVGTGPGTFTGLRIGLATARGLSLASGTPAAGVGSLEALARGISSEFPDRAALPLIDARRGQVFASLAAGAGRGGLDPVAIDPAGLIAAIAEPGGGRRSDPPLLAAGGGAIRFRDELKAGGVEVPEPGDPIHHIRARHICELGAEAVAAGKSPSIDPIYLRAPDAQRWLERDGKADPNR